MPAATENVPAQGNSPTAAALAATAPATSSPATTDPAVDCTSPAAATIAETEGPYFKAGSPERSSLLDDGMPGTKLILTGYVLTTDCKPVANAMLDFWQADLQGVYDNSGYTLRGHQFTDQNGRFQLETVVPGLYPGRTEHIHVKVQAPNGPILTTQLFFPGVTVNDSDSIFDPSLLINLSNGQDPLQGTFNFVVSQ